MQAEDRLVLMALINLFSYQIGLLSHVLVECNS